MSLLKDLPELVSADIISNDTAKQIAEYYKRKQDTSPSRQLLIFGILGAILVGTGVMFIVANQWDQFSQYAKTTCAFLLLIIPQLFCVYVLLKKTEKVVWREIAALLLFFAIGANISLVSQIYHINGDASTFLMVWMLLSLPLIYLLDASALSLAYFFGLMIYCFKARYNAAYPFEEYIYWILFILPLPRYYQLFRKTPESALFILHHLMIPLVLTVTLQTLAHEAHMLMYPAYIFMFALFYFIGQRPFFKSRPLLHNGYLIFGFVGTIISFLVMSFKATWKGLSGDVYQSLNLIVTPEFIVCVLMFALATILLYRQNYGKKWAEWKLMDATYLAFLILFILGAWDTTLSVILINLLVFIFGLSMLREGLKHGHLGLLNIGMLLIALLVGCRSFDTDLTLFVKGTMFVLVGIGFFAANWLIIKKRKENEA